MMKKSHKSPDSASDSGLFREFILKKVAKKLKKSWKKVEKSWKKVEKKVEKKLKKSWKKYCTVYSRDYFPD